MEGLAIGATGLGIKVIESTIQVLGFIHDVVVDARHYGEQTQSIKTKIIAEVSRLNSLESYLQSTAWTVGEKMPEIANLRPATQSAVLNLLQELDISFAVFSAYIRKHNMEVFKTGYAKSSSAGPSATMDQRLALQAIDAQQTQESTPRTDKLLWGAFTKKKVIKLVDGVKEWNDTLMNVLLCDKVFGKSLHHDGSLSLDSSKDKAMVGSRLVNDTAISTGLKLRALMDSATAKGVPSMIDRSATLEIMDEANRIAKLRRPNNSGGSSGSFTEMRVYFEKKPFELRRRAIEPSEVVKARVESLGRLLSLAHRYHDSKEDNRSSTSGGTDTGFHTLRCVSIVRLPQPETAYAFAFQLPERAFPPPKLPVSLLQAIQSKTLDRPTLEDRFTMARSLVQTVFQLHSVGWLHKSIRSENVVFGYRRKVYDHAGEGEARDLAIDYEHPYLVGFEFSREDRDRSTTEQDGRLERNIYRHPDRQGPPEERFNALHDIYSLGVVLLEIGLWRTAFRFEGEGGYDTAAPETIMRSLLDHARRRLPHYVGIGYTEVVRVCLEGQPLLMQTVVSGEGDSPKANTAADDVTDGITLNSTGLTDAQRLDLNLALLEKVLKPLQHPME